MNIQTQLQHLINLALIDHDFSVKEKNMIVSLAKANKIPEEEINEMMEQSLNKSGDDELIMPVLTGDEKFEYLYNIVQLMKIDSEVFLSEIKYCELLAVKLGYNRKVISALSQKIFSDPSITSDRDRLKESVAKFSNN
jgi:hypothetical protein